jgi:hypothetical protein
VGTVREQRWSEIVKVRLTPRAAAELRSVAAARETTLSALGRQILSEYMRKQRGER